MQDHMTNRKFSFPIFAGFIVILGAIFALIYHYSVYTRSVDFHGHMHFIRRIQEDGLGSVPHFLYHIIILGVAEIFPTDWYRIAEYLMVFVSVITGITIYLLLTKWFKHYLSQVMIGFLTICILTITPIIFWTDYWPALLGYIHPTVYHNPTQTILKMFVIPISLIALRGFNPKPYKNQQERIGLIILSIVLIVLMSLSKPNYTIILLPALGLYCLYRLVNKQELDWGLLIFGIGLPAVIVLALQFLGTYTTEDSTIQLGFLTVLKFYIPPPALSFNFYCQLRSLQWSIYCIIKLPTKTLILISHGSAF